MTIKIVRTTIYQRACRRIMTDEEVISAKPGFFRRLTHGL
jgi:hypothetical protein